VRTARRGTRRVVVKSSSTGTLRYS
jgi:hypothetical protein